MAVGQFLLDRLHLALSPQHRPQAFTKAGVVGDRMEVQRARLVPAIGLHQRRIDTIQRRTTHQAEKKPHQADSTILSASGMAADSPAAASASAANTSSAVAAPATSARTPRPPSSKATTPTSELEKAT